jgi:hypothetical protein
MMVSEDETRFFTVLAEMVFPDGQLGGCVIERRLGTCNGCQFMYVADCHICCRLANFRKATAKDKRRIRAFLHEYPEMREVLS